MPTELVPALSALSIHDAASKSVVSLASASGESGDEFHSTRASPERDGAATVDGHVDLGQLQNRINASLGEINRLNAKIYEIEELRHSTSSAPARLDGLLGLLDAAIVQLQNKVESVLEDCRRWNGADPKASDVVESSDELHNEWQKALAQVMLVKEEMREDGWLVRFRTTADQAEAMMEPLQKSLSSCARYVERIQASPQSVQYEFEEEDALSLCRLKSLAKSHEAMKGTYVPSIVKILRMMDRSINDRSTFNGEALRRFSEMSSHWATLQRSLASLDAKIRVLFEQYELSPAGEPIEVLADATSPSEATLADSDYFGIPKLAPGKAGRGASISSRSSSGPYRAVISPGPVVDGKTISSSLKKRPSIGSNKATADGRPRWNSSTKSESVAASPSSRRSSLHGAYPSSGSPAPPVPPLPDFAKFAGSRIPIRSPPRGGASATLSPAHSSRGLPSTSYPASALLSPPASVRALRSPDSTRPEMRTPRKSGAGIGLGIIGAPLTPNLSQRAVSSTSVPRSHRMSMGRAPPSSFRSSTPTPSRPSSRLSNASSFPAGPIPPFVPSKYDLLDQEIQKILEETAFSLTVSRLDASLKKGQRKGDNDEWKGEFLFGAGEKATSVKLLKINTTVQGRKEMRYKVMGRAAGAWMELGALLRKKMDQSQGIYD